MVKKTKKKTKSKTKKTKTNKKAKTKTSGAAKMSALQKSMREEEGKRKEALNEFDQRVREACAQHASVERSRGYVWDWLFNHPTTQQYLAYELVDQAILSNIYQERSRIRREIKYEMVESVRDNIPVRNTAAATRAVLNGVHKKYMLETWPTEFGVWFGELTAPEIETLRDREVSMRNGHGAMVDFYGAVLSKLPDRTSKVSDTLDVGTLAKMMAEAYKQNNCR